MKKVNWEKVIRKCVSKFGYVCLGTFGAVGIEYGFDRTLIIGMILALAVGILATLDINDFKEE